MAGRSSDNRVNNLIWGVLLSLAGIGLLLFNLDVFVQFEPYVQFGAAALLGLLALLFVGGYLSARDSWWRLIPGWTLIALAAMVYLTTLPALDQRITASVLFVGQAIAFLHIYLLDRADRWWAIIPGGFMLMLGGTIALSSITESPSVLGTFLFIGLGAVFFLLYLLGQRWQLWWALVPGSVLVLLGLFLFSVGLGQENLPLRLWPVLLPLLGAWLIWRATRPLPSSKLNVDAAPNQSRARSQSSESVSRARRLGEYGGPAPGAAVEVLPDPEEAQ
ncbi:MAG: hypothetical protein OXO50_21740 [Caldilineaceae bacterium]|nr:hypothetical protein [Caldilineaceae bacterium]